MRVPRLLPWGRTAAQLTAVAVVTAAAVALPVRPASADGADSLFSFQDERINESSGLAASHRHPGVFWTHNDSDDGPYVYAVDSEGRTVATVTVRGMEPRDVEAVAVTPSGEVYLADIGDNLDGQWPEVWIYRFTEPETLADTEVDAVRYRVQYEDGPRNAEAVLVHPKTGRVYIASKEKKDNGGLYAGPRELTTDGVNTFSRVAPVPWVTDGAFSPDGTHLVLRGYLWAAEYAWRDGRPTDRRPLAMPIRGQGEAVTYSADGRAVLFGSEGSGSTVWRLDLAEGRQEAADRDEPGTSQDQAEQGGDAQDQGAEAARDTDASDDDQDTTTRVLWGGLALVGLVAVALAVFRRRK